MLRDTVEIAVDVTDDEEYGMVYVASNDDLGSVTDGQTFEELLDHLREALELCLAYAEELNFVASPHLALSLTSL